MHVLSFLQKLTHLMPNVCDKRKTTCDQTCKSKVSFLTGLIVIILIVFWCHTSRKGKGLSPQMKWAWTVSKIIKVNKVGCFCSYIYHFRKGDARTSFVFFLFLWETKTPEKKRDYIYHVTVLSRTGACIMKRLIDVKIIQIPADFTLRSMGSTPVPKRLRRPRGTSFGRR